MLNRLFDYVLKWDLVIDKDKFKIDVFRNGGKIY